MYLGLKNVLLLAVFSRFTLAESVLIDITFIKCPPPPKENYRVPLPPADTIVGPPCLRWPKGHGGVVDLSSCRQEGSVFSCFIALS